MSKTDFMVVSFSEEGEVNALHRDQFSLGFLGKQKIERASDIKFDEESQTWTIWLLEKYLLPRTTDAAKGFASYDQAREVEVGWLEQSAFFGVNPLSEQGIKCLKCFRANNAI